MKRVPTPGEAEALQARAFAAPAWLEPYALASYSESGLTATERILLERYLKAGDRLLDVGCGTGREALGFAREGLVVTAVDACAAALERAPRHERVKYVTGALSSLEGAPRSHDAAFVSSDVYGTLPGRANRVEALRRLARLVRPGGPILYPAVISGPRSLLRALRDLASRGERGDRLARGPSGERLYRHVFETEDDVRAEAAAASLSFERVSGTDFFVARAERRRFRPHPDVKSEAHGGDLVLVHMSLGTTFRLNPTGRAIFALAGEGLSSEEVAARLRGELAVDEARLEADAHELMDELARCRLLVPAS